MKKSAAPSGVLRRIAAAVPPLPAARSAHHEEWPSSCSHLAIRYTAPIANPQHRSWYQTTATEACPRARIHASAGTMMRVAR